MTDDMDADLVRDHLAGVELELVEAVEQQQRAEIQGDSDEVELLQIKIDALHAQLAATAEVIDAPGADDSPPERS